MTKADSTIMVFSQSLATLLFLGTFTLVSCENHPYREGERLYRANCANCHMDSGEGLGALIPPLASADYLRLNREKLPCVLRYGLQDTIVVNGKIYAEAMPGATKLSEIHITNILNYVNTAWGNANEPYRLDEVRMLLENCAE